MRRTEAPVIVDPTSNYGLKPLHENLQIKVTAMRQLPLTQYCMHRPSCFRADCRDETDEHFPRAIHRSSGPKGVAQKIELHFWISVLPVGILAVHDPGLLRMQFQVAFRKPLPQHIQQLTSLLLTVAMDDRIVCIALEWTRRKLPLHPRIERVVKEKIRQHRADHSPYTNGNLGRLSGLAVGSRLV